MASDHDHTDDVLTDTYTEEAVLPRLKDIASMVTRAAEANDLETVLERIASVSGQLVGAKYAALGIPDGEGGLRYFKVWGITPEDKRKIGNLPHGHGLLGVIMNEREIVRLEHMRDDSRSVGFPPHHPEMESLLGVPIMMGDELFGMLYLTDRIDGKPFTEQDQWLIEVMASYAALAIGNSQLQEQRNRLALLEERDRIMMELHDGVIQSIYAIGMQVELLSLDATSDAQLESLRRIIGGLNTVIEDIRSYIQNLRSRGDGQFVRECIEDTISRIHVPAKLTVDLKMPGDLRAPLSPPTFEAVCQIAFEAMSNVVRHANATHVEIDAAVEPDAFTVTITDNGQGFDPNAADHHSGLGLNNIQQRARMHGGQVNIESHSGEGTRIIIWMPIKPL
jgi:signal transduction histidine kinase